MIGQSERLQGWIEDAIVRRASCLHLLSGDVPRVRTESALEALDDAPLADEEMEEIARALFGERGLERQRTEGRAVRTTRFGDRHLVRAALASTRGRYSLALALRRAARLDLEGMGIPAVATTLASASHGLLVVSGPSGSGKTTTLYALAQWIVAHRPVHLITVEDPIEYELEPGLALVQQREVGTDVPSVAAGIEAATEQDLDVLMLTQMQDLDSLSAALYAAQTGHLVLVQVHAALAADALTRIVEAAPTSLQPMVRRTLAETIVGVLSQRLLPKATGEGRVPACGVLVADDALRDAVVEGRDPAGLRGAEGSVTLLDEVRRLAEAGTVAREWVERLRGS